MLLYPVNAESKQFLMLSAPGSITEFDQRIPACRGVSRESGHPCCRQPPAQRPEYADSAVKSPGKWCKEVGARVLGVVVGVSGRLEFEYLLTHELDAMERVASRVSPFAEA